MAPSSDSRRATTPAPPTLLSTSYRDSTLGLFALLLALRVVNALSLRTFFQPDEFFQSLEPAWQLAFGPPSNAWITWVNSPSQEPSLAGCMSHDARRSGERNCGRPCIQRYLLPSIESRQICLCSVA